MTLSQALIGEAIPPRERARYQGYIATVAVSANTFGPVAGGYLTEHFGWQSIFLVNVPIGLGAVALTWRLPTRRNVERLEWRADPGGLILFTVFVATTLLALEQAQHVNLDTLPLAGGMGAVGLDRAGAAGAAREPRAVAAHSAWAAAHAGDLAQRRHGRLPRRRAGVADHVPAGLSASRCAGLRRRRPASCWCRSPSASAPARW